MAFEIGDALPDILSVGVDVMKVSLPKGVSTVKEFINIFTDQVRLLSYMLHCRILTPLLIAYETRTELTPPAA